MTYIVQTRPARRSEKEGESALNYRVPFRLVQEKDMIIIPVWPRSTTTVSRLCVARTMQDGGSSRPTQNNLCSVTCIDYRFQIGDFPVSASCVTISNPDLLSSS